MAGIFQPKPRIFPPNQTILTGVACSHHRMFRRRRLHPYRYTDGMNFMAGKNLPSRVGGQGTDMK